MLHATDPSAGRRSTRWTLAALLGVLLVAWAIRALPTSRVFTPDGVRLAADGDTYYHALRAERIASRWPEVPWTDPGMNHPYGAEIPWPPLLDQIVATVAIATGPITPDRVAATAARVPPVLGSLLVLVTAALAAVLLGRSSWEAALLVALLPAAVRQSFVGRPDHHVLEVLLGACALLALVLGMRRPASRLWPVLLAAAVALSFWNWAGSALSVALLCACVGALHLASPETEPARAAARTLALGAGGAAALLLVSIAAWGPPGAWASLRLTPITGLSAAFCALAAAGAAGVLLARRFDSRAGLRRRALHLLGIVAVLAGTAAVASSVLGGGVAHGLRALGATTPWYATITEFWPLLGSGRQPWTFELRLAAIAFGLTPLALPLAARALARSWDRSPERRAEIAVLVVWVSCMVGLALLRRRFEGYAVVPLAVAAAAAIPDLAGIRRALLSVGIVLVLAAPGLSTSLTGAVVELPYGAQDRQPLLDWLEDVPARPGRAGVLAPWSHGHEIQWLARKPAVSTPFGTDIDPRALRDQAAFFTTVDPADAEALLDRREIGFLLLENPVREVATLGALVPGAPTYALEERSLVTGSRYAMHPSFFDLVVARLYFFDGATSRGDGTALEGYRLLAESATEVDVLGVRARQFKLFGVVEGARLRVTGAAPGESVVATVEVRTNRGRSYAWRRAAVADGRGEVVLRVPYATGANGVVAAGPCVVRAGNRSATAVVPEGAVVSGETLDAAPFPRDADSGQVPP